MGYLIASLSVALVVLFLVAGIYNGLVRWRNHYRNAWAQIDVQRRRRYDLIPNLVEATRAYLSHERGTLEAVISARAAATFAAALGFAPAQLLEATATPAEREAPRVSLP